jgi:SAM-dependent methyltransferase
VKGQEEYDYWSLNQLVKKIEGHNGRRLNEIEKELITKANPTKILDIGCGNGKRLFSFLDQLSVEYIGLEKFQRLAENSPYLSKIIIASILDIDLSNPCFKNVDCITILGGSLNGIFGYENHKSAWNNIIDLLQVNGKIIFDAVMIEGFDDNEIGERKTIPKVTPLQFFLSEEQLKNIWSQLNVKIIEARDWTIPAPYKQFKLRYYLLEKAI